MWLYWHIINHPKIQQLKLSFNACLCVSIHVYMCTHICICNHKCYPQKCHPPPLSQVSHWPGPVRKAGWPVGMSDPTALTSLVLELQVCVITRGFSHGFYRQKDFTNWAIFLLYRYSYSCGLDSNWLIYAWLQVAQQLIRTCSQHDNGRCTEDKA